jgi:hypothetical protein
MKALERKPDKQVPSHKAKKKAGEGNRTQREMVPKKGFKSD